MYYTPGGWILAFEAEMTSLLLARSGPIGPEGRRFQGIICSEHPGCVLVRFDAVHEHVRWKDRTPEAAALSLVNRLVRS
jgi:hypothetical protein